MLVTKEQLLQDPYGTCEAYNTDPQIETEADDLFFQASRRIASLVIYGDIKPAKEVVLLDIWDFYTEQQRQVMANTNHPFYQAWLEAKTELGL